MNDSTRSTFCYRAYRWANALLLVVLSVSLLLAGSPFLDHLSRLWTRTYLGYGLSSHIAVVLAMTCLWLLIISLGGFRLSDLWSRTTIFYPPTWLVGVIASLIFVLLRVLLFTESAGSAAILMCNVSSGLFLYLLFGIGLALLVRWVAKEGIARDGINNDQAEETPREQMAQPSAGMPLNVWFQRERPISNPNEDILGYSDAALAVAKSVAAGGHLPTFWLEAPYGSGKTSFLNLVEFYLRDSKGILSKNIDNPVRFPVERILTCRVEGWGLTSDSAAQRILDTAVKKVAGHIDGLGIVSLPGSYRRAASSVKSGLVGFLAAVSGDSRKPNEVLQDIDHLLCAGDFRLVVFIEDFERSVNLEKDCAQIEALLDGIKNLQRVSFILAKGY